jgi:predicted ribosome-associated RNA-binding protein Tma20
MSDLRPGDELVFLDGGAHKDLVAGADVPVPGPGWLARTSS